MHAVDIESQAIAEAIASLGYVTEAATEGLSYALALCGGMSATAVMTRYRKSEPQISRDEKRELGIRGNAFMSRKALVELTDKGRIYPLKAHETTLLRAYFTALRYREIAGAYQGGASKLQYNGPFGRQCTGCTRLHETVIAIEAADPKPPADCDKEGCALGYWPKWEDGVLPPGLIVTGVILNIADPTKRAPG